MFHQNSGSFSGVPQRKCWSHGYRCANSDTFGQKSPMKCIKDQRIKNTKDATLIPESVLDIPDF